MEHPTLSNATEPGAMRRSLTKLARVLSLVRPAALVLLSLWLLPWSLLVAFIASLHSSRKKQKRQEVHGKRILITGASTPTGLALARLFHSQGHTVIAAEHEIFPFLSAARLSRSVAKVHCLKSKEAHGWNREDVRDILEIEGVDLWIPCGDLPTPIEVAHLKTQEGRTQVYENGTTSVGHRRGIRRSSTIVNPNSKEIERLCDSKTFGETVDRLGLEIRCPHTYRVSTRSEIHAVLGRALQQQSFVLEPFPEVADESITLPKPTMNETYEAIAATRIGQHVPWLLKEVIKGTSVETKFLVIRGRLGAFTALRCGTTSTTNISMRSSKLEALSYDDNDVSHASPLSQEDALHQSLLDFTIAFMSQLPTSLTAHLGIRFIISDQPTPTGIDSRIWPIQCILARDGIQKLTQSHEKAAELVNAYLSAQPGFGNPHSSAQKVRFQLDEDTVAGASTIEHKDRNRDSGIQMLESDNPPLDPSPPPQTTTPHVDANNRIAHNTGTLSGLGTQMKSVNAKVEAADKPVILAPSNAKPTYSLPLLLLQNIVLPVLDGLFLRVAPWESLQSLSATLGTIAAGKEELWDPSDPWPWVWEWHVRVPLTVAWVAAAEWWAGARKAENRLMLGRCGGLPSL